MNFKSKLKYIGVMLLMMLSLGSVVGAKQIQAAETKTGNDTIVINSTNDIDLSGQTFDAYQLFTAEHISDDQEKYTIVSDWQGFFDDIVKNKKGDHATSDEAVTFLSKLKYNPRKLSDFADAAYQYATKHNIKSVGVDQPGKDQYKITGLANGYYLVSDTTDSSNKEVVSKDMLVTVDSALPVNVTLKADAPTILKTINGTNVVGDYQIGDKIPFTIVIKNPTMEGYDQYKLSLNDTLGIGLTFNNDMKITVDGKEYTDYELKQENQKLTVNFAKKENGDATKDNVLNSSPDKLIKVTYSATVNNNAVMGGSGNTNIANVTYSNNPYSENSTHTTPDSKVTVYTYELDIIKQNTKGTKLQGAEFQLKDKDGHIINLSGSDGNYTVATTSTSGSTTDKVVSNKDGQIKIKELDTGKYQLVETKAPDGYKLLAKPLDFEISAKYGGNDLQTLLDLKVNNDDKAFTANKGTGIISTTVINNAGGLLPKTGGRGVILLVAVGLFLIATATVIVFRRRKA